MENVNSVCFTARVEQINTIEGADKIVQAIISGWECVVQKDIYSVGDFVILATTDAVIPLKFAEQLGVVSYLKHRKKADCYTVKTTKLRGVYSTALVVSSKEQQSTIRKEGTDMMEVFGITKYEEPEVIMQTAGGKKFKYKKNPNFHVYYKFPNIKNAPNMFTPEDFVNITRKIHGCNARYAIVPKLRLTMWDKVKRLFGNKYVHLDFVYGSHQAEKGSRSQHFYSSDVWNTIGKKYDIERKLWKLVKNNCQIKSIILYGEIYGEGIQKYYNYGLKDINVKFFDIELNGSYLSCNNTNHLLAELHLPQAETLYLGVYNEKIIQRYQYNNFIGDTKIPEEGVVVKAVNGDRNKIAKFINPAYLEFQAKKEDSTDFH